MKKKAKWILLAVALIGLITAVVELCQTIHSLGCIALFDEEDDDE